MKHVQVVTACALALLTGCADHPCTVSRSISYDPAFGYRNTLDIYEPVGDSLRTGRPVVVAIHGGAWRNGDKAWAGQIARELCPYGYVVAAVNYRLSSRPDDTWPAQIVDVQKAIAFLRANAQRFRIDAERIASLGFSAGGHLATMAALRTDPANPEGRVRIAVNLNGEHDMTMPPSQVMDDFDDIMTLVLGQGPPWSDTELRDISTVTFARPDVSVLTVHGAGDDNVYVAQGDRITDVLRNAGADVEYVRIEGRDGNCHESCWKNPDAGAALHRFLDRTLAHDGAAFLEKSYTVR